MRVNTTRFRLPLRLIKLTERRNGNENLCASSGFGSSPQTPNCSGDWQDASHSASRAHIASRKGGILLPERGRKSQPSWRENATWLGGLAARESVYRS